MRIYHRNIPYLHTSRVNYVIIKFIFIHASTPCTYLKQENNINQKRLYGFSKNANQVILIYGTMMLRFGIVKTIRDSDYILFFLCDIGNLVIYHLQFYTQYNHSKSRNEIFVGKSTRVPQIINEQFSKAKHFGDFFEKLIRFLEYMEAIHKIPPYSISNLSTYMNCKYIFFIN